MTYEEFENMVDNLVKEYSSMVENVEDKSILDFLHSEDIDREIVEKINPLHIVREIHYCNSRHKLHSLFADAYHTSFSYRFRILLGLCEMVEFVNRTVPKFKYNDIVWEKKTHEF